jgi:hypothetical protein
LVAPLTWVCTGTAFPGGDHDMDLIDADELR